MFYRNFNSNIVSAVSVFEMSNKLSWRGLRKKSGKKILSRTNWKASIQAVHSQRTQIHQNKRTLQGERQFKQRLQIRHPAWFLLKIAGVCLLIQR